MRTLQTLVVLVASTALLTGCFERPPIEAEQNGFRGTAMATITNPRLPQASLDVPAALPAAPQAGPRAGDIYQNVEVLGDLSVAEFTRTMNAITAWVSPEEGCNYCHYPENLADDGKYQKIVSRRMFQMTQHINQNWDSHVGGAGVTCYTCHRGKNVPEYIWFAEAAPDDTGKPYAGWRNGQNIASESAVYSSLPGGFASQLLMGDGYDNIRVISEDPNPTGGTGTIQDTEWTYALMMHMSDALGVNCTFCHNSRAFSVWSESPPQRVTAWHGIRMVAGLNNDYLDPLAAGVPGLPSR